MSILLNIMQFFSSIGKTSFRFFDHFYEFSILGLRAFSNLRRIRFYYRQVLEQFYAVGTGALPVVFLAATFTGMVIATQAVDQMQKTLIPRFLLSAAILKAVLVELGPVLTALILAGRIGSGISAEIGTMRVSEQIDALESLALDPYGFLVMPRILSGFLILPALNFAACFIAIVSSYITVNLVMGLSFSVFAQGMQWIFRVSDIWFSTLKAFCFGGFITWTACYFGMRCESGAKGVGKATTSSVVVSLIGILFLDYIIIKLFPLLLTIIRYIKGL